MKKKMRLFILCHEYYCAIILSVFGALLTTFIIG